MKLLNRRRTMNKDTLPYDSEVEYLEVSEDSEGTIIIDTEFVPNSLDLEIYCNYILYEYLHQYGIIYANTPLTNGSGYWRICGYGANYGTPDASRLNINNKFQFGDYLETCVRYGQILINGKEYALMTDLANYENNKASIKLLNRYSLDRGVYAKLYSFKIVKADELIIDLIPVRKGNEGFMYDRVSGKLYGNSGSGRFIIGPDKEPLYDAEVEYLETNDEGGEAYINTGLVPTGLDNEWYIEYMLNENPYRTDTSYGGSIFSAYTASNIAAYRIIRFKDSATSLYAINGSAAAAGKGFASLTGVKRYIRLYKDTSFDNNGVMYEPINTSDTINTGVLNIFNPNSKIRIYTFKWDKGDNTILDLIPVRKNGIGYMYNKIDGKLYGNSGEEGSYFIIGPDKTE